MKKKEEKKYSYLLIFLFIGFILMSLGLLVVRPQKKVSDTENRTLNRIDLKTIKGFLNGDFQNNLSDALPDQIILSETLKKYGNNISLLASKFTIKTLYDENRFGVIPIKNGLYKIAGTDYIVYPASRLESLENASMNRVRELNTIKKQYPQINVYAYKITREIDFNFREEYDSFIKERLDSDIKYSSFSKINSYDDYKKYFYKSDHHWSYEGQYEGYKEIATLLGFDEFVKIKSLDCFDVYFRGSKSRQVGDMSISDQFCAYNYDLSEYVSTINGNVFDINAYRNLYYEKRIPKISEISHYANFYGADHGELIYDFKNNAKENILVFVDSYSNPINELIASHYKTSYFIDLRNYENLTGKKFNLNDYLQEHEIQNILILGNVNLFVMPDFNILTEG